MTKIQLTYFVSLVLRYWKFKTPGHVTPDTNLGLHCQGLHWKYLSDSSYGKKTIVAVLSHTFCVKPPGKEKFRTANRMKAPHCRRKCRSYDGPGIHPSLRTEACIVMLMTPGP